MIIGVGTDSIEIKRVARAAARKGFLEKYFTEIELSYFSRKGNQASTVAGNFAGKEAVAKALGTGFNGFMPGDVEILRDENGKPIVNLCGPAKELAERTCIRAVHVSITHNVEYATAFAVAEGEVQKV